MDKRKISFFRIKNKPWHEDLTKINCRKYNEGKLVYVSPKADFELASQKLCNKDIT